MVQLTSPSFADFLKVVTPNAICSEPGRAHHTTRPPLLLRRQPSLVAPPVPPPRRLNGSSEVSVLPPHRWSGSQLSHPPPRVRKSADIAPSSGSRRPAGTEAYRAGLSPRPRPRPQVSVRGGRPGRAAVAGGRCGVGCGAAPAAGVLPGARSRYPARLNAPEAWRRASRAGRPVWPQGSAGRV